jgi:hypothetical protein
VLGVRPLREEVKLPVPEPSLVFVLKEMVGVGLVDHTTPLEVTAAPPSELIVPPDDDVVGVIELITEVINVGTVFNLFAKENLRQISLFLNL